MRDESYRSFVCWAAYAACGDLQFAKVVIINQTGCNP
jgi:hypothetical protein